MAEDDGSDTSDVDEVGDGDDGTVTDDAAIDGEEVTPAADPGPEATAPAEPDPGPVAPAEPTTEAPAPSPPLTKADLSTSSANRWIGPVLLGATALLLVGFVLGRVTAPEGGTVDTTETTLAEFTFPVGDQDRTGYWGFGGVTPAVIDTFDGEDDPTSLGSTDTGQTWQADGTWGTVGGQARTTDALAVATVNGGAVNRLTEATLMVVDEGAGITFRYLDADNHWRLTAAPGRQVWELTRVVEGQAEVVGEIGAPVQDGTTITVAQRGPELQVLVDGTEVLRISDAALSQQARSGLISVDGDGSARWDRFYVGNMPAGG